MLGRLGQRVRPVVPFDAETTTPTISGYVESRDLLAIALELASILNVVGTYSRLGRL